MEVHQMWWLWPLHLLLYVWKTWTRSHGHAQVVEHHKYYLALSTAFDPLLTHMDRPLPLQIFCIFQRSIYLEHSNNATTCILCTYIYTLCSKLFSTSVNTNICTHIKIDCLFPAPLPLSFVWQWHDMAVVHCIIILLLWYRIRVRVPTRASSKKKEARGIYQHAEVIPGRDWITTTTNQGE